MRPLVSAAAAALLLVGARRGGAPDPHPDDDRDRAETHADIEEHAEGGKEEKGTDTEEDWDWTHPPDDSSIWAATAAVLSGAADVADVLQAAVRGLGVVKDSAGEEDEDEHPNDFRPLIAVTIGVTLFLLTRSSRVARRAELEAGVGDGSVDLEGEWEPVRKEFGMISDLRAQDRSVTIVTTAALPWMTGTAVNPVLRAAYLAKRGHSVTLVVPWLESPEDQKKVYPKGRVFRSREEQREEIVEWGKKQVADAVFRVRFYEGVYSKEFGSILPLGDITAMFVDDEERDVCVLEEPEHLTWHHTGKRWTSLFAFVIGVVHTNYLEYAKKHGVFGPQRALFLSFLNKWVCRSYCHRVIKLSDAVQTLPHSVTCNVHGVRDRFIDIGKERNGKPFERGAYFLGKVLWAKGYRQLVDLMDEHYHRTGQTLPIDFFGAGPDLDAVKKTVKSSFGLSQVQIHGLVVDHASDYLQRYKVYVNPSKSDVVCTATAEALAMGKFVVCLKHPSNEFFSTFDNCLIYQTEQQFSEQVEYALANEPKPLSQQDAYRLSWEAATERFYDASYIPSQPAGRGVDSALAITHKTICSTLVTPPANNAVRARYRSERRSRRLQLMKLKRERARRRNGVPVS